MKHRYAFPLKVRYADTDAQGHVFFANYLTFMDEALTGYFHAIGCSPAEMNAMGVDFVYADAQCSYRGRAFFEDVLSIHVAVARVGNTSFTTSYGVYRGDELVAEGRTVTVCVDAKSLAKTAVPERLSQAIAAYDRPGAAS